MTDEHAQGERETDKMIDKWHERVAGMTQEEINTANHDVFYSIVENLGNEPTRPPGD